MREIINQVETAELATTEYNSLINQPTALGTPKIYACVQAILTSAALVSKLL